MAPIFSSPDIAAVVAAFPSPQPTQKKAALVRSRSGDRLLHSARVRSRFERLLQDSPDRIAVADLPHLLGIKSVDWLISQHNGPLLFCEHRRNLLPNEEATQLRDEALDRADKSYLNVTDFATEHGIALDSFIIAINSSQRRKDFEMIQEMLAKAERLWLFSYDFNNTTITGIHSFIEEAGNQQKTELGSNFSYVPKFLLRGLAEQVVRDRNLNGTIHPQRTRLYYIPAEYETMMKEKHAKQLAREFSKILVQIHRHGYHSVPSETQDAPGLREVFLERTKAGVDDGSFSLIHAGDAPIAIAFSNRLESLLQELKSHACQLVVESQHAETDRSNLSKLDDAKTTKIIDSSSSPEFSRLVLQDIRYLTLIEQSITDKMDELDAAELRRSNEAFNDYVRLPIRHYLVGLSSVQDFTLKQRLDKFVLEFLQKDLIPPSIQHLTEHKLIKNNNLAIDVEKFVQSSNESKSLSDLQAALTRFARRNKFDTLSQVDENRSKTRILQQKAKSVTKMTRASDVLQNLIWILLARDLNGLFISSGKDTTRMIKLYQSVGDAELGRRLEVWKDKFKIGQETPEDLEAMKSLAAEVVSTIVAKAAVNGEETSEE